MSPAESSFFSTPDDILSWQESFDLEFKLAQWRNGQGELPASFWETYSAFANTVGWEVWLGIEEKEDRTFDVQGIGNPGRIKTDLFNLLNNQRKVSANILTEKSFEIVRIDGKDLIRIVIPKARRKDKPIYLNGNPLGNTYHRTHDGDRKCSNEVVRRMLAEQVDDSRDARILKYHGMEDVSTETLQSYRQALKSAKPDHPALSKDDKEFLRLVGGWKKDRETWEEGLTVAGLLMFGFQSSIQDEFPDYVLDYQERPEARKEARWIDRITTDGTWSGNLFDFYARVYRKLIADLKVPFSLVDGQRKDFTPVHEALREALVNTLVHADYSISSSVLIVKRPDMFGFRNPGLMRVPLEIAKKWWDSDCRNKTLQQMFLNIGYAERGGFGLVKIFENWQWQHWRSPVLREIPEREQTLMELYTESLFPKEVFELLTKRFGDAFGNLGKEERLMLATAHMEHTVNHARLMEIVWLHPHDLTLKLQHLISIGLLDSEGQTRGKTYFIPDEEPLDLGTKPMDLGTKPMDLEFFLYVQPKEIDAIRPALLQIVDKYSEGMKRLPSENTKNMIMELCKDKYLSLEIIAELLWKNPEYIRTNTVKPLLKEKKLAMAFPRKPNDPRQAYTSSNV